MARSSVRVEPELRGGETRNGARAGVVAPAILPFALRQRRLGESAYVGFRTRAKGGTATLFWLQSRGAARGRRAAPLSFRGPQRGARALPAPPPAPLARPAPEPRPCPAPSSAPRSAREFVRSRPDQKPLGQCAGGRISRKDAKAQRIDVLRGFAPLPDTPDRCTGAGAREVSGQPFRPRARGRRGRRWRCRRCPAGWPPRARARRGRGRTSRDGRRASARDRAAGGRTGGARGASEA